MNAPQPTDNATIRLNVATMRRELAEIAATLATLETLTDETRPHLINFPDGFGEKVVRLTTGQVRGALTFSQLLTADRADRVVARCVGELNGKTIDVRVNLWADGRCFAGSGWYNLTDAQSRTVAEAFTAACQGIDWADVAERFEIAEVHAELRSIVSGFGREVRNARKIIAG